MWIDVVIRKKKCWFIFQMKELFDSNSRTGCAAGVQYYICIQSRGYLLKHCGISNKLAHKSSSASESAFEIFGSYSEEAL